MARGKKDRLVHAAPRFSGFKPFGLQSSAKKEINLHLEEYEAIKLCDYEMLTHKDAAQRMGVSRPTFSRIYESSRQKVAKAMVEAAAIRMDSGHAIINADWPTCDTCKISYSAMQISNHTCPFCKPNKSFNNNQPMVTAAALVQNKRRSLISEHFGRCEWYGIYDLKSRGMQFLPNTGRLLNKQAGLLAVETLLESKVNMVVAGGFGAKVVHAFKTRNVQMVIPQGEQTWTDFIRVLNKL